MFYSKTEILPLRYDDVFCCYPWKFFIGCFGEDFEEAPSTFQRLRK